MRASSTTFDSSWLIVRWADQKAFLQEEANADRLREHNEQQGHRENSPVAIALEQVFRSTGEDLTFYRGALHGLPDAVCRVRARAGLADEVPSPVGYVDRQGKMHLPFDEALQLGQRYEYRASWALIRQWAGLDAAVAAREAQIQKLERLAWDAVYALQKAGLDSEAARLRRAVETK